MTTEAQKLGEQIKTLAVKFAYAADWVDDHGKKQTAKRQAELDAAIDRLVALAAQAQAQEPVGLTPEQFAQYKQQRVDFEREHFAAPQPAAPAQSVEKNNPMSALSIRLLVAAGHVSQEKADEAFSIACRLTQEEAERQNISLPWVLAAPTSAQAAPAQGVTDALYVLRQATSFMTKKARDGHAQAVADLERALAAPASAAQRDALIEEVIAAARAWLEPLRHKFFAEDIRKHFGVAAMSAGKEQRDA